MDFNVSVKGIEYEFVDVFSRVVELAQKSAKELYLEEQEFRNDEFKELMNNNEVSSYEEYIEYLGETKADIDYSLSFEDNISHPDVAKQINELTYKYMCNVKDLPKEAVITIDDTLMESKNKELLKETIKEKLANKFGIDVKGFLSVKEATKSDIAKQNSYESIGKMIESKDFKTFLELKTSIEKYSFKNIAMIYAQATDAKAVMGFHSWKEYGRMVAQGQSGISIWQPCKKDLKTQEQVENEIANNEWFYGKPDSKFAIAEKERMLNKIATTGKVEVFSGYKLGTVFDVSQTKPIHPEQDNIWDIINLNKPLKENLENYGSVVEALHKSCVIFPLQVQYSETNKEDALYTSIQRYVYKVFQNAPEQINGIKSNTPSKGDMLDIEATMATYLICRHIGINSEDKISFRLSRIFNNDLSDESIVLGKREMFSKSFDRACCFADQFTKAFDKEFGYDRDEQMKNIAEKASKLKDEKQIEFNLKADTRVWFGRQPAQIVDSWKQGDTEYVIGKFENFDGYSGKAVKDGKSTYLKDGKNIAVLKTAPTKENAVDWLELPKEEKSKNEVTKE